jgi:aspartyl-tRNA(Asn)/glutamyl-tRNA(Gln) amidotransferase subunit B
MAGIEQDYEIVIGLEVHAQLQTESKLFCGDSAAFGAAPNTHVSPITLGHPGTLPRLNSKAIEYAIRMGLVCNCEIERYNYFARKNYFYPDLPKGYQVSQHTTPICKGGYVTIHIAEGSKKIPLTRIHLEEDAGKSIHDVADEYTCLDYNRAGVPLIEIVSEPDMRSAEEAFAFLSEIRKLVRWIGVCDGNMEEGSLRCDANISVRLKGDQQLGTKVEVKNLNSIRNVKKAIEVESARLIRMMQNGETILQETRSFNADNDTTFSIRTKEDADDYRYFPEPDLTPFSFTDGFIADIQKQLPELPETLYQKYTTTFGLSAYDARVLSDSKELSEYFESICAVSDHYKSAANWLLGPVKSWLNENAKDWDAVRITPHTWSVLFSMVESGSLSFSLAAQKILPVLLESTEHVDPLTLAKQMNLLQDAGKSDIQTWVDAVLEKMPDKVQEYRKGKKGLIGLFVGEVKKISRGKADPKITNELLLEKLNQS